MGAICGACKMPVAAGESHECMMGKVVIGGRGDLTGGACNERFDGWFCARPHGHEGACSRISDQVLRTLTADDIARWRKEVVQEELHLGLKRAHDVWENVTRIVWP